MKHLIIGGAGFIGCNLACDLLDKGEEVVILDNLSRKGSEKNLEWLMTLSKGGSFKFVQVDIRLDFDALRRECKKADRIYHLAAQVAVTTSVEQPREDFEINALGTFNVLEAMRLESKREAGLIYASTNKVYGGMEEIKVIKGKNRYRYKDYPFGVSEKHSLDFHSPYGCSKGCGDQYVRDYARIYGLNTVVFRQSCIYGPRQFGVEDQGWVAWFIIAVLTDKKITIYGDGKQVRDVLYVEDLVAAYHAAFDNLKLAAGEVFNVGGGPKNVISVWADFGPMLERLFKKEIKVSRGSWRPGDQKIYVSDIRKVRRVLSWQPSFSPIQGIEKLYKWAKKNKGLFT